MSLLKIRKVSSLLLAHVNSNFKRLLKSIIDNCQIIAFCQIVNLKCCCIGERNKFCMDCWGWSGSYLEKWQVQWIIQQIWDLSACKLSNHGFKSLLFHSPGSISLLYMYRHNPFYFPYFSFFPCMKNFYVLHLLQVGKQKWDHWRNDPGNSQEQKSSVKGDFL